MVKETKAVRQAREAEEQMAKDRTEWAEFTAGYPANFANLMFEYAKLDYAGFRIKKLDHETYFFSRDDYSYKEYELKVTPPVNYVWEYLHEFDQAYELLHDYAREKAEESRKQMVRSAALDKLSKEERELLGI